MEGGLISAGVNVVYWLQLQLSLLDFLSAPLQQFSATLALPLAQLFGLDVVRSGTIITLRDMGGYQLQVAAECSGLRLLFALLAFSVAYAHLALVGGLRRWLLVFLALPLALAANVVRVASIIIVTRLCGIIIGTGLYHQLCGYIVMFAVVMLQLHLGSLISSSSGE